MNFIQGISELPLKTKEVLESLFQDRTRTNLLKKSEQAAISYLVQRIPRWITSDMLTGIGFMGSVIVFLSIVLATYFHRAYLLISVLGFAINWFGDSLDGRLAYYRNKPRKLYGFTLDITIDWMGIILIGCGYIIYVEGVWELLGYGFVVMYGWEMIIALMRYRLTGKYSIDSGKFGPTEVRIVISLLLIAEVILKDSLIYTSMLIVIIMFFVNIADTRKLLRLADEMDIKETNRKFHEKNN
jgi:phosphatidylglycerophosphate synthase